MTDPQSIVITSVVVAGVAGSFLSWLLLFLRRRARQIVARGICVAAVVVTIAATPWFTDFLLLRLNSTSGLSRVFIDLGAPGIFLPTIVVLAASFTFAWFLRARDA